MSLIDDVIHNRDLLKVETEDLALISLNELFNESMKKAHVCYALPDVIVRCETLPLVLGRKVEISNLFDHMLGMIFRSSPNGPKLFLFIECESGTCTDDDDTLPEEYTNSNIKFYTNLTTDVKWKKIHEKALARSGKIISSHHWKFVVNHSNHKGCLFLITLPGKFE